MEKKYFMVIGEEVAPVHLLIESNSATEAIEAAKKRMAEVSKGTHKYRTVETYACDEHGKKLPPKFEYSRA